MELDDDEDEGPEVPSELAGVILHRSIKGRVKDEDEEDEPEEEDATGEDGLDEDDIAALGG